MSQRLLAASLASLLLAAGLGACSKPLTTQQQIIAVIRDMEARVEKGERRPFMNHVAESFHGQGGYFDHQRLNAWLLVQMRRNDRLRAQLFPISVSETDEFSAEARFNMLVTGGDGWLPERGQMLAIRTEWRKIDGDWQLIAAEWQELDLNLD